MSTILLTEKALFRAVGAKIEEQASKGRYARAPWNESPSVWKSALQKAIRQGDQEKAQEAAAMMMLIPWAPTQSNLMNRLRTILLEDIGIGYIGLLEEADRLLSRAERARDAFFRGVDHDANVTVYRLAVFQLVDLMTGAPRKTRFLSHALCVLAKTSSDWVTSNVPEFTDLQPGPLAQKLEARSVMAIGSVYKYYHLRTKKTAKFPMVEATSVFRACRAVMPNSPLFDILERWFHRGYSENELTVYSAVLVAIFRDHRRRFESRGSSELTDANVSAVFLGLANRQSAPEPLDVAFDMHTRAGKKRKRGPIHFAVQSSVVHPEYAVPLRVAPLLKKAYLWFKEFQDSQASEEDRALIRRRIADLQDPVWPQNWSGQEFSIECPISDLISQTVRAQKGNKNAKTLLGKIQGIPGTVFIKGPFDGPIGRIAWKTQAFVDSIKPLFGLQPIGVLGVISAGNRRDLLMRDLNEGVYSVDAEGIVDQTTVKAERANWILSRVGVLPNQEGIIRILLFRAAWGISDSNGNNILFRGDLGHWYSVDENVMFSEKAASRLATFSIVAQNHKATRPVKEWLRKFNFRPVLAEWLKLDIPAPPRGSVLMFQQSVKFMLYHYDSLSS